MSNRPLKLAAAVTLICSSGASFGQSPELLEAIRIHKPTSLATARGELDTCLGSTPVCDRARALSLLIGYLELSEGDAKGAVEQLRKLPAPKGLEAFHGWYLAEAMSWSGERPEALKLLKKVRPIAPVWLKDRIESREAELTLALGPAKAALPMLEAAVRSQQSPELIYQRGLARAAVGNARGAMADFLAIYVRFPTHPHAFWAEQRLGKLNLSFEDRLARAERFIGAGDHARALGELEGETPKGKAKKALEARAALVRAQAWYGRGDEAKAAEQLDMAMGGPPAVAAEAMMLRARKLMRAGENRFAREMMEAIDARYPDEWVADEAAYLSGWISIQNGDYELAVTSFEHFEERHKDSRKRDEARWFRAWALFRGEQYQKSREVLGTLMTDFPNSALVPQAHYWWARATLEEKEKKDAAKEQAIGEFQTIINTWPGTFYAVLARERLFELGVQPPELFSQKPQTMEVETPRELALATELSRSGLLRDAWEEVQRVIRTVRTADNALTFGHALQGLGDYAAAHQLAARLLWGQVYAGRKPEAIALMYPRAFRESVERNAKDRGLDPFFAWAIMRRESTFRPEVVSAADARGLMQIIPPTARAIAAELKIEAPDPDTLYSPADNIMMGTWYLSALMSRFGHMAYSAAAYNAGPTAVIKWANARKDLPLDMWVEEISFKETRGYVKQVMADYFIYKTLYGTEEEKKSRVVLKLPVPKETGVSF
jgi:soluble lytic murein transglycosylase